MSEPLDVAAETLRSIRIDYGPDSEWHDEDVIALAAEVERLRAELARRDEQITAVRALGNPEPEEIRMNAYYYCFDKTGVAIIDRILSAVAHAGKAFHHTEMWSDTDEWHPVSYADQIQKAADTAAQAIRAALDGGAS